MINLKKPVKVNRQIREMTPNDWEAVQSIYSSGLAGGNASFETKVPDWETWDVGHMASCRIVAHEGTNIAGWGALSRVSAREVYSGVAEVSVYVAPECRGLGVGELLLRELISRSEAQGIWTLQSGIFPENIPSIKLHEKCGFRKLGVREKIGQRDGIWRDTVLMERRSRKI